MHCYRIHIAGSAVKTDHSYHLIAKVCLLGIDSTMYYENEFAVGIIATGTREEIKMLPDFCQVGYPLVLITNTEIFEMPYQVLSSFGIVDEKPKIASEMEIKQISNNK
jgi:hypothetical protein